jgi:hypothetical protein
VEARNNAKFWQGKHKKKPFGRTRCRASDTIEKALRVHGVRVGT